MGDPPPFPDSEGPIQNDPRVELLVTSPVPPSLLLSFCRPRVSDSVLPSSWFVLKDSWSHSCGPDDTRSRIRSVNRHKKLRVLLGKFRVMLTLKCLFLLFQALQSTVSSLNLIQIDRSYGSEKDGSIRPSN